MRADHNTICVADALLCAPGHVRPLVLMARKYAKLMEKACNVPVGPQHDRAVATTEAALADLARAACARAGVDFVAVTTQGDPRGHTVTLVYTRHGAWQVSLGIDW